MRPAFILFELISSFFILISRLDPYMLFGLLSFLTFIFYVTFRLLVNNGQGRSLQEDSGAEISSYMQHFVNSDPP